MQIISVPAKNLAFAALESMMDARLSLDGKDQALVFCFCVMFSIATIKLVVSIGK